MASTADLFILLKVKDEASKALHAIGKDGLGGLEKAALGAGVALAGALAAGLAASIMKAAEFEKQMSAIKAVTGATAEEMQMMSKTALQLGKDTSFSALEAAKGIEELAKGGVSATEIMDGAAKAALDLAAAGGVPVAEAAALAANAMSLFNIEGKDMAGVVNQIAGFANATTGSVNDFKFALASVGASAKLAGQDFDQTATALGVMAKAGLVGSDAGTSLKAMLAGLIPVTDREVEAMTKLGLTTNEVGNNFLNADGSFKDLRDISEELHRATVDLTESERKLNLEMIFGQDGVRAAGLLAEAGADGFDAMADAMGKVTAEAVAAERLDNLAGTMEKIGGSVETAAIQLGTAFLPVIKKVADGVLAFVNDSVIPFVEENAPKWAEAIDTTATAFVELAKAISGVKEPTGELNTEFPNVARLMEQLRDAAGSDTGLAGAFKDLIKAIGGSNEALAESEESNRKALTPLEETAAGALRLGDAFSTLGKTVRDVLDTIATKHVEVVSAIGQAFSDLGTTLAGVGSKFDEMGTEVRRILDGLAADMPGRGATIGGNLALGIANGITGGLPSIVQAAAGAAGRALEAAKAKLDEHSWSKEGWKIGYWFSEGEAIGIDEGAFLVAEAAGNLQLNAMAKAAETLPQWTEFGKEIPFDMALGIGENADSFYTAVSALANGVVEPQQKIALTFEQLLEQIVGIAENHDYQLRLGSAGASLMAALDKAINDATPQNIQTVANMAFKMLDTIQKQFGKGDLLAQELMSAIQNVILDNTPETVGALERVLEQVMRRGEHFAGIAGENVGSVFVKSVIGQIDGFLGSAMDRAVQVAMGAAGGGSRSGSSGGLMGSMQRGLGSIGIGGSSGGGSLGGFGSGSSSSRSSGGSSSFPGMNTPSMRGGAGQRPPGVPGDFVYDSKTDTWKHPQYAQLVVNVNSPIGVNNLMQMVDQGIRAGQITSVPRGL